MDPESQTLRPPGKAYTPSRLEASQKEVDEITGIMKTNVQGIIDRGEKLEDLEERASSLLTATSQFEKTSSRLKKTYRWKNQKMKIIIGVVAGVVIAIIVVGIVLSFVLP
ncbi:vesicle-associated membrane protein 2-like [Palaemon carinicauda]|uniref:vesicle-associated membrane protein 2-like n=1 Tax=Palaemon carinicauda TaxID=392227 RepID=UPI0035B595A2